MRSRCASGWEKSGNHESSVRMGEHCTTLMTTCEQGSGRQLASDREDARKNSPRSSKVRIMPVSLQHNARRNLRAGTGARLARAAFRAVVQTKPSKARD